MKFKKIIVNHMKSILYQGIIDCLCAFIIFKLYKLYTISFFKRSDAEKVQNYSNSINCCHYVHYLKSTQEKYFTKYRFTYFLKTEVAPPMFSGTKAFPHPGKKS